MSARLPRYYVYIHKPSSFERATKEAVQTLARLGMSHQELAAAIRRCLNNMVSISPGCILPAALRLVLTTARTSTSCTPRSHCSASPSVLCFGASPSVRSCPPAHLGPPRSLFPEASFPAISVFRYPLTFLTPSSFILRCYRRVLSLGLQRIMHVD